MSAPMNNDLPVSNGVPGVYVQIDPSGSGVAVDNSLKRAMIVATRLSTGTQPADTPVRTANQTDINAYFGRGSDAARMAAAFLSQVGPGALDLWVTGVNEPSSGVASVYDLTVYGPATSAGSVEVSVSGYKAAASVASGDAVAVVAAAIKAELDKLLDLPITWALATSVAPNDTVRGTYRHRGVHGEDLPIQVNITGATGIKVSPGLMLFASSAVGDGSCTVKCGGHTVTAAITGGDTPGAIATAVDAAINAASGPLYSSIDTATVTLYYRNQRDVRRVQAKIVTSTGTTINSVAAGSTAYIGTATSNTPGSGVPSLTNALTNIGALSMAFGAWCHPFADATSCGAIATFIETQQNGLNQKGQIVHIGSAAALATAGAIPAASSPALTAYYRHSLAWCVDFPQQAYEIAARCAAAYLDPNYVAQNYDGTLLKTTGTVPLGAPHVNSRAGMADANAALMTYFMTPIVVNDQNQVVIMRGRTCSNSVNQDLWEWSTTRQLDYGRIAVKERLSTVFAHKSYKRIGTPKTPNTVTPQSVVDCLYVLLMELDDQDLFDGAEAVKQAILSNVNALVAGRFDVFIPWVVVRSLHQIAPVIGPQ